MENVFEMKFSSFFILLIDSTEKVTSLVAPPFSRGVLSLDKFIQILAGAPDRVSAKAADRLMAALIGHVNDARKQFDAANVEIHRINKQLDSTVEELIVQEKSSNDQLLHNQNLLSGINASIAAKMDEKSHLQQQLSDEERNLSDAGSFLDEKRRKLDSERTARNVQAGFTAPTVAVATVLGALLGPVGAVVAGSAAAAGMGAGWAALQKDVDNAESARDEAESRVDRTRQRVRDKTSELSNLKERLRAKQAEQQQTTQTLNFIVHEKEQIKQFQGKLATINDAIKSCTAFVDTTASRAKIMADEANDLLPDIEAMLVPLRAIASDLGQASVSNCRLLSGGYNLKAIGNKMAIISFKAQKSITNGEIDGLF